MAILLIALVIAVSLYLTFKAWRSYENALRSKPGMDESPNLSSVEPFIIPNADGSDGSAVSHHSAASHHAVDCGPSHHGVCDSGHGFDGGHFGGHH
jgi:hypothetical protein